MIKSHTIENKFLRVKTLNIGATLFEVFYKKKKINLILNLGKISSYNKNKNYLGIYKFNLLTNYSLKKVIALGGVSDVNIKLLSLTKSIGFAGISFFNQKKGP